MGKRTRTGKCHICGKNGELSFEHVPPEKAFNNKAVEIKSFEGGKGRIQQRGMGEFSLCKRCNNNTGRWYGSNFVKFCHMGMEILQRSNGNPRLI